MSLRPLLLSIAAMTLLLGAGCRTLTGGGCHKTQPYQEAGNLPPLHMPAGLEGPDTSAALEVPELAEPEAPVDRDGPCLDAPPALTAPPLPPSGIEEPLPPGRRARRTPAPEAGQPAEEAEQEPRRRRPPSRPR